MGLGPVCRLGTQGSAQGRSGAAVERPGDWGSPERQCTEGTVPEEETEAKPLMGEKEDEEGCKGRDGSLKQPVDARW